MPARTGRRQCVSRCPVRAVGENWSEKYSFNVSAPGPALLVYLSFGWQYGRTVYHAHSLPFGKQEEQEEQEEQEGEREEAQCIKNDERFPTFFAPG